MDMITSDDVKSYSSFSAVQNRGNEQMEMDILEADAEIKSLVGHDFSDPKYDGAMPAELKLAYLKMAQYFALINSDESIVKGYKSESAGDYSYTLADNGGSLQKPDIDSLISGYVDNSSTLPSENVVKLRMRGI